MVKAVNSGGEAQSIADFMVLESQPDRMVEVTKTVVFSDLPSNQLKVRFLAFTSFILYKNIFLFLFYKKKSNLKTIFLNIRNLILKQKD